MSRYLLKTLGCKANLYDTQQIEQELQKRGWLPGPNKPGPNKLETDKAGTDTPGTIQEDTPVELCIVNSCTVTNEADKQSRKMATRLARENPHAVIVMTGCGAEVDPEGMSRVKGVHYVVGNQNKPELVDLVLEQGAKIPSITSDILNPHESSILGDTKNYKELISSHPMDREWPVETSFSLPTLQSGGNSSKTRCFLKIQEGCNSFCTYCIIPYGRGPSRSLRPHLLIQQIRELVEQGLREVILTGTNIGDYGKDWGKEPILDLLIEMILTETQLERLRVSSLDPTEITPKMLSLMRQDSRFCPHFHVSLQSPHSRILRLMKRPYRFEQVQECLLSLKEIPAPVGGAYVGMDVITGFPGETEEEFEWSYNVLATLPWTRLHVFPYSERAGTPATKLPGSVPQSVRVDRARRLNELSFERLKGHYRSVLEECKATQKPLTSILMERGGAQNWSSGHTLNYLKVMLPSYAQMEAQRDVQVSSKVQGNDVISAIPLDLTLDTQGWDVALVAKPTPLVPILMSL